MTILGKVLPLLTNTLSKDWCHGGYKRWKSVIIEIFEINMNKVIQTLITYIKYKKLTYIVHLFAFISFNRFIESVKNLHLFLSLKR